MKSALFEAQPQILRPGAWPTRQTRSSEDSGPYVPTTQAVPQRPMPLPPKPTTSHAHPMPSQSSLTYRTNSKHPAGRKESPFEPFLPQVHDPTSLAAQTKRSAETVYQGISQLMQQNALLTQQIKELKAQNQKQDELWRNTLITYETLHSSSMQKQMVLFEQIQRLNDGKASPTTASSKAVSEASTVREGSLKTPKGADAQIVDGEVPKLDPSAATFIPSPKKDSPRKMSPFKGASGTSKELDIEEAPMSDSEGEAPPIEPQNDLLPEDISYLSRTFTQPFRNLCPHSLVYNYACSVPGCSMSQLCNAYNDESGDGCQDPLCKDLHVYRTCLEEVDGLACSWHKVQKSQKKREVHFKKRGHRDACSGEEWTQRLAVAELREEHRVGRYKAWEHFLGTGC